MARPSKLTADQLTEIQRRKLEGESFRALAKEFGVDESTLRGRISPHTPRVREIAQKLADVKAELATLPPAEQGQAVTLADKLRNISTSLASAAELGAATSHRLQQLAHAEVAKVKGDDATADGNALRGAAGLVQLANQAANIPLNLLASNKERVRGLDGFADKVETPAPVRERLSLAEWKKHHGIS